MNRSAFREKIRDFAQAALGSGIGRKRIPFVAALRESALRDDVTPHLGSLVSGRISFITGFPQKGVFLDEFPALSLPFLETKLSKLEALSRERQRAHETAATSVLRRG